MDISPGAKEPDFCNHKLVELKLLLFKLENLRLEVINEARDERTFNMRPINLGAS